MVTRGLRKHYCTCGSGLKSWWLLDARGIELCHACEACEEEKLKGYRSDVLTDPNYDADEPIEE
jgi:hypothetical protein